MLLALSFSRVNTFYDALTFLTRFNNASITSSYSHREHPQRYHSGEIEWTDSGCYAERLAVGVRVDALGDVTYGVFFGDFLG